MTFDEMRPAAEPMALDEAARVTARLPLVSVIVVNYNYGRFLAEAVDSVFDQTYPRVECLVVDNASTDGSETVLAACKARHPSLQVLARPENDGQTVACLEGLARTRGAYVVFLDADDYLLPHCLAAHIAVHLSARVHVGFTSGDMLQLIDGQTILSVNDAARTFFDEARAKGGTDLLRPTEAALGAFRPLAERLAPRVALVPPTNTAWIWAATSGNCFRRDALDLICDNADLPKLRSQTDLYLALGLNLISGSILIDEPLFAYRLHGANVFTSRAQLQGLLTFDTRRSGGQGLLARRLLIDHLIARVDRFVQEPWMIWTLLEIFKRLDLPVDEAGPWHGRSYAARAVDRDYEALRGAGGTKAVFNFIFDRVSWRMRLALVRRRLRKA